MTPLPESEDTLPQGRGNGASSALKTALLAELAGGASMSIAAYMSRSLLDPKHGYYTNQAVFGRAGDFITAPEISQMFGEIIGLWCRERWMQMGRPPHLSLIELGPGRGTMMADMLRTIRQDAGARAAFQPVFIEASPALVEEQRKRVPSAKWAESLAAVPPAPSLIVANEFFDALPVYQFQFSGDAWQERCIVNRDGALTLALAAPGPQASLIPPLMQPSAGDIAEVSPASLSVMGQIADRIERGGGAALVIDYGHLRSGFGDTLQAVRDHAYTDPLDAPGLADITAHVDFSRLKSVAGEHGLTSWTTTQGAFLMQNGLGIRAQQLAQRGDADAQQSILAALQRLSAPDQMGELFKVLACQSPTLAPPPGFDAHSGTE